MHVKAFVELPNGQKYCDGEINIPVHVRIEPEWLKEHTEKVQLEFESHKVCDNPVGACSQLFKEDPVGWLWGIDNARWFSTQPDQCNKTSTYVFAGKTLIHCAEVSVETSELEVDASQNCVQGAVRIKGIPFDGTLSKNCYSIDDE